jgi:AhpD family alkylhydroperoxidase
MAVAVALTAQCVYCIEVHRKSALDSITAEAEVTEAIHVAMARRAGAAITEGMPLLEP